MAIKNYTSDKPLEKIFAELQQTLGAHGAKQISYEYGDDGKVQGVEFAVIVHDHRIRVKLPARIEQAQAVLKRQWDEGTISHKRGRENTYGYEQAYRVAWRNILDWVQAQMALLEIGMAKMEEVFLPYMLDTHGRTLFERMEQRGFLLDSGKRQRDASRICQNLNHQTMFCEHTKRIGDNYGVSCQDCQAVLEGFGYGGWFGSHLKGHERCMHIWWKISAGEEECLYCHMTRERVKKAIVAID